MLTMSLTSLRRTIASTLTVLVALAAFSLGARAQSAAPAVIGSFAATQTPPTGFGGVLQTAVDNYGNWIIPDWINDGLYEIPAGGGALITLAGSGVTGGVGGYQNPSITFDSYNNMYLAGNFNNCLLMFPWDPSTKTWPGLATLTTANTGTDQCGYAPYSFAQYGDFTDNYGSGSSAGSINYFQPWGIAMLPGNLLVIGSQAGPNFIYTMQVDYPGETPAEQTANDCSTAKGNGNCSPTGAPGTSTMIVDMMKKRPNTVAADKYGNIYFTEDGGGLLGAYMVPAGETNLASDQDPSIVRIDPDPNTKAVTANGNTSIEGVDGVATDTAGNIYISDNQQGVYFIPANPSGTPDPTKAVLLTPLPAVGSVSADLTRGLLYVPTTNNGLSVVSFNAAQLGSTAAGTPAATSVPVYFAFNAATTPGSFAIEQAGASTPDFTVGTGGTCAANTAQAALTGCTVDVTLDPQHAGPVAAGLQVVDTTGNVLGSLALGGTGVGADVNVLLGGETAIDSGLSDPKQVAVDAAGNTYVADAGLKEVLMFAQGSSTGTKVGTGLVDPTGVAVDGAGDVFIGDSGNGTVVEVPETPSGLNAAGQVTVISGLGMGLNLAVSAGEHLYITDPQNGRVIDLKNFGASSGADTQVEKDITAGLTAPSAVATDSIGDLFVADGANLIEFSQGGTSTTVANNLTAPTGLAVDASGSVYVSEAGGTIRIPNVGGTLTPSSFTSVATDVSNPLSVAIDSEADVYIADGTNGDVDLVNRSATTNFGTQSDPTAAVPPSTYTILNSGNATLTVTGFTSTPDYSVTSTNCTGNTGVASGSSCSATVTFNPGPGDTGTLTGQVLVQGNETNPPVGINATGVGAALAASTMTVTVNTPTVDSTTVTVTVAPSSGSSPVPTGSVTLTIAGAGLSAPWTSTQPLKNGVATFTPPQLPNDTYSATGTAPDYTWSSTPATYTVTATYQGDRAFTGTKSSTTISPSTGTVTMTQPSLADMEKQDGTSVAEPGSVANSDGSCCSSYGSAYVNGVLYVLAGGTGAQEPYDGTVTNIEYNVPFTIATTDGQPLLGAPNIKPSDGTVSNYNYGSVSFQVNGAIPNGCSSISVGSDGTVSLPTSCVSIDTSNTTIPDLETSYTLTPVYSPNGTSSTDTPNLNYGSVTGTPISFTALSHPVVVITSNPSSLNVTPGSSASATLTLTSLLGYGYAGATGQLNNYGLPVDLSCDGLPAYATCTFTYPPAPAATTYDPNPDAQSVFVTPLGTPTPDSTTSGPATVLMTITTNVPTNQANLLHRSGGTELATVFGLSLLGLAFGKRRSLRGRVMTMVLVLAGCGIVAGSSGCSTTQLGGANSSSTTTPAGTYNVLITAKEVGSACFKNVSPCPNTASTPGWVYGNQNQVSLPFTMSVTIK